jgi:hypothetical protein
MATMTVGAIHQTAWVGSIALLIDFSAERSSSSIDGSSIRNSAIFCASGIA